MWSISYWIKDVVSARLERLPTLSDLLSPFREERWRGVPSGRIRDALPRWAPRHPSIRSSDIDTSPAWVPTRSANFRRYAIQIIHGERGIGCETLSGAAIPQHSQDHDLCRKRGDHASALTFSQSQTGTIFPANLAMVSPSPPSRNCWSIRSPSATPMPLSQTVSVERQAHLSADSGLTESDAGLRGAMVPPCQRTSE